ncbi:MAG: hypothetical protein ACSW8E_03095 [Clostridia bacterium]
MSSEYESSQNKNSIIPDPRCDPCNHAGGLRLGRDDRGGDDGFIQYITDEILLAAGEERDALRVCERNVAHGVELLRREFAAHPEIPSDELEILGAVYDVDSGEVRWL